MSDTSTLGAGSCGVWTRREALEALSPHVVDRLVATGVWQSPWPGIYADAGHVLDARQEAIGAVLASGGRVGRAGDARPRVVVAGRTLARLHGLPLIDDDDPATAIHERHLHEVAVTGHQRVLSVAAPPDLARPEVASGAGSPQRVLRRLQLGLPQDEVRRLPWGLWGCSPARNLLVCAGLLTHEALVCAVDAALHARLVTLEELQATAAAHAGGRTAPRFRVALGLADGRSESPAETLARLVLKPALPRLEPQVRLLDRHGRLLARFDLGDEEAQLAVEADGKRGHAGELMVARDRQRDRLTAQWGWTTERVTWFDCRRRPAELQRRVLARHAQLSATRPRCPS